MRFIILACSRYKRGKCESRLFSNLTVIRAESSRGKRNCAGEGRGTCVPSNTSNYIRFQSDDQIVHWKDIAQNAGIHIPKYFFARHTYTGRSRRERNDSSLHCNDRSEMIHHCYVTKRWIVSLQSKVQNHLSRMVINWIIRPSMSWDNRRVGWWRTSCRECWFFFPYSEAWADHPAHGEDGSTPFRSCTFYGETGRASVLTSRGKWKEKVKEDEALSEVFEKLGSNLSNLYAFTSFNSYLD